MLVNATVILAKCSKSKKLFGMRVEKREKTWVRTWAFPIDESKAKHEGFDKNKVSLGDTDSAYPGCPHCRDGGFVKCGNCGKIGCGGGAEKKGDKGSYTCPWCGNTGAIEFVDSVDASGSGY